MTRREVFQATAALGALNAAPAPGGNIYTRIGVKPFINLTATYTINGGTLTLPEVKQAMDEASRFSVNIDELMDKVSERLAALLGCEHGIVTSGCAAALAHATAACVAGADPEMMQRLPDVNGLKSEVVIPRQSRNQYDHAMRMIGTRLVEVDTQEEFRAAVCDRTAMIAVLGVGEANGKVRLEEIAETARKRRIPVLVDAAAEIPRKPNPYLSRGADLVAYSGGKIIRGPQCAGLLLGRRDLVRAAWISGSPHHTFGRPMKVGKEEIMGMLAAVEALMTRRDIPAEYRVWEGWLGIIGEAASSVPGVRTKILPPAGASPFPVLDVAWDAGRIPLGAGEIGRLLLDGEPRIMSHAEGDGHSFVIRPAALEPGQAEKVAARLKAVFLQAPEIAGRKPKATSPAADIAGEWVSTLDFLAARAEHRLTLKVEGDRVAGVHRTRHLQGELAGSISGNEVRFTSAVPFEGVRLVYEFKGRVSADRMSGEVDLGEYGRASWSARRA